MVRMGDDVCSGPFFVKGMGVAEGMANDSSRDFSSSRVDESLSCDIIRAHSSSWGGVPFGSSRHLLNAT